MQRTTRDHNHRQDSKVHHCLPSSSYETRSGPSLSQCSPLWTSHLTRLMKSNCRPIPHLRRDIGDESADVDIATTDGDLISLPSAVPSKAPRSNTRFRRSPRVVHLPPRRRPINAPRSCCPLLPRRRSLSQRLTSKHGLSLSSTSSATTF